MRIGIVYPTKSKYLILFNKFLNKMYSIPHYNVFILSEPNRNIVDIVLDINMSGYDWLIANENLNYWPIITTLDFQKEIPNFEKKLKTNQTKIKTTKNLINGFYILKNTNHDILKKKLLHYKSDIVTIDFKDSRYKFVPINPITTHRFAHT